MSDFDFIGMPGIKVFIDPRLPVDEDEPTGERDEDGNAIHRITGKKIHAVIRKEEMSVRVSQEFYDKLVKHYGPKPNP